MVNDRTGWAAAAAAGVLGLLAMVVMVPRAEDRGGPGSGDPADPRTRGEQVVPLGSGTATDGGGVTEAPGTGLRPSPGAGQPGRQGGDPAAVDPGRRVVAGTEGRGVQRALYGVVRSVEGAPVDGAEITIRTDTATLVTESAPDGLFVVHAAAADHLSVEIQRDGFETMFVPQMSFGVQFDPRLWPTAEIQGTLVGPSGPLPGILVEVYGSRIQGGTPARTVVTDAEGGFMVSELPGGLYDLKAAAPDLAVLYEAGVRALPGQTGVVDLRAFRGASLTGRVFDPLTDRGVDGARIVVEGSLQALMRTGEERWTAEATADGQGNWRIDHVPPGRYRIAADKVPWFVVQDSVTIQTSKGDRIINLEAERGGTVSGLVRGPDDKGVPGAMVAAVPGTTSLRLRQLMAGVPPQGVVLTHTDEDGRFTLEGVPPGFTVTIIALGDGMAVDSVPGIRVASEEALDGVLLRLEKGRALEGQVLDPSGLPAGGAAVRLEMPIDGSPVLAELEADAEGRFLFVGITAGRYRVRAEAGDAQPGTKLVSVPKEGALTPVEVRLEAGTVVVGFVQTQQNAAVAGATVVAIPTRGRGKAAPGRQKEQWAAVTDRQGMFRLEGLPIEQLAVYVRREGLVGRNKANQRVTPPLEEPLGLGVTRKAFEDVAEATFKVLDDVTYEPVIDLRVDGVPANRVLILDGKIRILPLTARSYRFTLKAPDYVPMPMKRVAVSLDKPVTLPLQQMRMAAEIRLSVTDKKGQPVKGAKVVAVHSFTKERKRSWMMKPGLYRIPGLEVGPWEVTVQARNFQPAVLQVQIDDYGLVREEVKLAASKKKGKGKKGGKKSPR